MAVLDFNAALAHGVHARANFQRADVSTVTETATAATATATVIMDVDDGGHKSAVKALGALVAIFGLLLIGILVWRIGKWRRSKFRAASSSVNIFSMQRTQARKAVPVDFDEHTSQASASEKRGFNAYSPGTGSIASPPPTYITASTASSPTQRPSITALAIPTRPPGIDTHFAGRQVPASPMVPTPRTSSFKKTFDMKTPITSFPMTARKNVPRTVVVRVCFVPTLADELPVTVGERLTMLEEYEDGWCQVQRSGGADVEKGVVPQFCVQ